MDILPATYISILIAFAVLTKIRFGTLIKGNVGFTAVWCGTAALASTGFYDLYKPVAIVHLYVFTVIIVFNVAYLLMNSLFRSNRLGNKLFGESRLGLIYIANVLSWLFMIRFVSKTYTVLLSGGFRVLRDYAFDSSLGLGSTVELVIAQTIIQPVFIATILVALANLVVGRTNLILLMVSFIDVVMYVLLFAGRALLVTVLVYYLLLLVVWNYRTGFLLFLKRSVKIGTVLVIVVLLLLFSFITQERSWTQTSSFRETYLYLVGPFSLLSVYFENNYVITQDSPYLYGKAMLGTLINPILMSLTYLFSIPYTGSDYMVTRKTATPFAVSPNRKMNALTTMIYPLYRDLGYIGIILGTAFMASVLSFSEIAFRSRRTLFRLCFYVLVLDIALRSTMNYYLLFPRVGVTIFLLLLFIRPSRDGTPHRNSLGNSGNVVREIENGR